MFSATSFAVSHGTHTSPGAATSPGELWAVQCMQLGTLQTKEAVINYTDFKLAGLYTPNIAMTSSALIYM